MKRNSNINKPLNAKAMPKTNVDLDAVSQTIDDDARARKKSKI